MTPSDRQPANSLPSAGPSRAEAPETVRELRAADSRIHEAYARWSVEIRSFLIGLTRDAGEAEELLQATFSRLVAAGDTAGSVSLRAWLFRVAHNEAMLARRKAGVRSRGLEAVGRQAAASGRFDGEPPSWAAVVRAEEVARVRQALERLPPEQRQVVEQRIYEGLSFAEIAAATGLPLGTVLTRMRLARASLAQALGDGG